LRLLNNDECSGGRYRRPPGCNERAACRPAYLFLAGLLLVCFGALAQTPKSTEVVRLRVLGGLDGVSQYVKHEQPFWTKTLVHKSGGRIQADITPVDRAGIRVQESLRLLQLGVVPFGTSLLSQVGTLAPELTAVDLAGLNTDFSSVRRAVSGFRPILEKTLREVYGVELLAVYAYPAQVIYCKKPFVSLSDLKGRKVRTSSSSQADLMEALGAMPVSTSFAELMPYMRSGAIDCAITGTMSGNTIGLHEITSHLHTLPLNWGLSVFAANGAAWNGLPADVRALLKEELPKLEAAIWAESERETQEGIACNSGQSSACSAARRGKMVAVPLTPQDEQLRRDVFSSTVLPRWIQRCGAACARAWEQSLGPLTGINPKTN
jgi:TRAP-type C4-dicarboxylate transport system substrate-binding protein